MLTREILIEKRNGYENLFQELSGKDVEAEVERRIQEQKEELRKIVLAEIECDKITCNHYIEMLDMLIRYDEENTNVENQSEEINENSEIPQEEIPEGGNYDA